MSLDAQIHTSPNSHAWPHMHTCIDPSCVLLLFYVPSALLLPAVLLQSNYRSALRLQSGDKKVNDQLGAGRKEHRPDT